MPIPHITRNPCYRHGYAAGLKTGGKIKSEYRIWLKIRERCHAPKTVGYENYGGRGIKMCDRWYGKDGFTNFLADMGSRPSSNHSIDRINNDGDYEPSNCRWATRTQQNRNSRHCVYIVHEGAKLCLNAWAEYYGINKATFPKWIKKYGREGAMRHGDKRRAAAIAKVCEG